MEAKKYLLLALGLVSFEAFSQGCIPIRNLAGFGQFAMPESQSLTEPSTQWLINFNQRYFEASQLYNETKKYAENPIEVKTTKLYQADLAITRLLANGWSISINLPVIAGSRTAWREHNPQDTTRYTTRSFGIGDVRLTLYKWLLDFSSHPRGNIQAGLGLKFATGDYKYQDYFNKPVSQTFPSGKVLAPVNSTIQLGDGGTGITLELYGFYRASNAFSAYGSFFYLANPRDQNGVSNSYGGQARLPVLGHPEITIPSDTVVKYTANINSVPDNYTLRAGGNFTINNIILWGGLRWEGAPVKDLIGKNNGQRRAGNILSVEPGINYRINNTLLYLFVPVPLHRISRRTVPDQRISNAMGIHVPSPGGFANSIIFLGIVIKV